MTKLSGIYWENVLIVKYLIKLLWWSPGINLIFLFDFLMTHILKNLSVIENWLITSDIIWAFHLQFHPRLSSIVLLGNSLIEQSVPTLETLFVCPPFKDICVCVLKPANTHSKLAQKPTENVAGLVCVKHIFEFMRKVSLFRLSLFSFRYFFRWANKSFLSAVCMTGNECHGLLSLAMCIIIIIKLI